MLRSTQISCLLAPLSQEGEWVILKERLSCLFSHTRSGRPVRQLQTLFTPLTDTMVEHQVVTCLMHLAFRLMQIKFY